MIPVFTLNDVPDTITIHIKIYAAVTGSFCVVDFVAVCCEYCANDLLKLFTAKASQSL